MCLSGINDMPNNGTTYTCQYENVNMPSDIQVGFIVNNTEYYLKYGELPKLCEYIHTSSDFNDSIIQRGQK